MHLSFQETGNFRDIPHLFHFLELLFVFFAKYGNPLEVTQISFPQWPNGSWKGKGIHTYNEWIVKKIFPFATIFDKSPTPPDEIIDRETLDHAEINKSWAKWIRKFNPYAWAKAVGTLDQSFPKTKPVVTYISRQGANTRRLHEKSHNNLVQYLQNLSNIHLNIVQMENLPWEEQLKISRETDLLIGVHGNGLSHAAFMHPHRNVIEIFTPGTTFHWDYYTLSKMMGHEYVCIFDNGPVIPQVFSIQNRICQKDDNICIDIIEPLISQIIQEK